MRSIFVAFCALFCAVMMSACGHNAVQFSDGVGLEVGFIPEQYSVSMNFRYGKIFTAVVKEKAEVTLSSQVANKAEAGTGEKTSGSSDLGTKTVLTLKTSDQTNGYTCEMERIKAGK